MFNKYLWENYLKAGGNEVVKMFEENLNGGFSEEYADKICELHKVYCPVENITNQLHEELIGVFNFFIENEKYLKDDDCCEEDDEINDNTDNIDDEIDKRVSRLIQS